MAVSAIRIASVCWLASALAWPGPASCARAARADDAGALVHQALADDLALGQAVARAPDPSRPSEEIYPGIVQIPGSWYVTLVRQDDGVVVLDAPISAGYSRRVLEEAARRFPGVPVKAVVASTGFYWHIAGLREYAALGIPVYVRDRNESIVRQLLAAPHTLMPDRLALHPRAPIIHPVSSCVRIGEGRNAIELMPVRRGEQAMVMSWIPQANLLHTAEMVQPLGPGGALLLPESLYEIARSVQEAGIPTQGLRIIGMHMSPTPWRQVGEQLASGPTASPAARNPASVPAATTAPAPAGCAPAAAGR